jgi:hypothetical protein
MFPPLKNLKFWAGAGLVALVLSSSHLLDGPSDFEAAQATEASLNDALAQAQAEPPANAHGSAPKSHSHPTAAPIAGAGT